MSFNYQEFVDLADELIEEFGRTVQLVRTDRPPADADKPWEGPDVWDDATADNKHKVEAKAAFIGRGISLTQGRVSGQQQERKGPTLTQEGTDIFIVSGSVPVDLSPFNKINDGDTVWYISKVVKLAPGDTVVAYVIEVHQ